MEEAIYMTIFNIIVLIFNFIVFILLILNNASKSNLKINIWYCLQFKKINSEIVPEF